MATNNPLFWIGLTVAGTGLYILLERHIKSRWWVLAITVAGTIAVAYSMSKFQLPHTPAWVYLLVLTWCVIGYDIYQRERERSKQRSAPLTPKLKIHSALYGNDTALDMDVRELLQNLKHDALVVRVTNETFGRDPVPGVAKTLRVKYSYDNDHIFEISRPENQLILLPEDGWSRRRIQDLESELGRLRDGESWRGKGFPLARIFAVGAVAYDPPTTDTNILYKNKVRVLLRNSSGYEIQLWTPLWVGQGVNQQGEKLGSRFRLMDPATGKWVKDENGKDREYDCLDLKVNDTVECYLGLAQPQGQTIERRVQTGTRLGVAIFPVKIIDKLFEVPVPL